MLIEIYHDLPFLQLKIWIISHFWLLGIRLNTFCESVVDLCFHFSGGNIWEWIAGCWGTCAWHAKVLSDTGSV